MCTAIICFPVYDVINFEINLSFLNKPLKSQDKNVNTLQTNNPFNIKLKAFFIIFKWFQLSEIMSDLRVGFEVIITLLDFRLNHFALMLIVR